MELHGFWNLFSVNDLCFFRKGQFQTWEFACSFILWRVIRTFPFNNNRTDKTSSINKEKINMKKSNLIMFVGIVVVMLQSCSFLSTELREIKFKPGMQEVSDKYKKQLEPEIFQTSPAWFQFDTITTHKVVVTVFNSGKLPKGITEKKRLALDIASEVYSQLENKEDFSKIEIVFQNESGAFVKMKTKSNYPFSYTEIEEYIESNKSLEIE